LRFRFVHLCTTITPAKYAADNVANLPGNSLA
jgi:hypothetical protein